MSLRFNSRFARTVCGWTCTHRKHTAWNTLFLCGLSKKQEENHTMASCRSPLVFRAPSSLLLWVQLSSHHKSSIYSVAEWLKNVKTWDLGLTSASELAFSSGKLSFDIPVLVVVACGQQCMPRNYATDTYLLNSTSKAPWSRRPCSSLHIRFQQSYLSFMHDTKHKELEEYFRC